MVAEIDKVVKQAAERAMATAVFSSTAEGSRRWRALGARMLAVGEDTAHILQAFRRVADETARS